MDVTGSTRVLGIIGDPIGHTLSPGIHERFLKATGQTGTYRAYRVTREELPEWMHDMRTGLLGINVTVPHKKSVIPYLDELTAEAREMGAVNAVRREGTCLIGHNTDGLGFRQSMEDEGISLQGKRVAILGAGGAAHGIGMTLVKSGAEEIMIVNRTRERGETLAALLAKKGGNARCTCFSGLSGTDIVINTTKVGMLPDTDVTPTEDFSFMKQGGVAYDAIYAPRETLFLQKAREAGLKTISGIGMLIRQAVLSYEFFTGLSVPSDEIERLYRQLSFDRNVALCGFMGSGKSTVGKCLAEKYSLSFTDTDQMIEAREGMEIKDIFREKGENYFREKENEVIRELSGRRGLVIALGGGAVMNAENRAVLQRTGRLIYLDASPKTALSRVGNDPHRPLLYGKSEAEVTALFNARKSIYDSICDRIVTDGKTPSEIVSKIVELLLTKDGVS